METSANSPAATGALAWLLMHEKQCEDRQTIHDSFRQLERLTWRMTAICAARRPTTCSFASIKRKRSPAVFTPCQANQF